MEGIFFFFYIKSSARYFVLTSLKNYYDVINYTVVKIRYLYYLCVYAYTALRLHYALINL